jgi:hypothetical protein
MMDTVYKTYLQYLVKEWEFNQHIHLKKKIQQPRNITFFSLLDWLANLHTFLKTRSSSGLVKSEDFDYLITFVNSNKNSWKLWEYKSLGIFKEREGSILGQFKHSTGYTTRLLTCIWLRWRHAFWCWGNVIAGVQCSNKRKKTCWG